MLGFDGFEFVEQSVVFEVADERRIQHVITVIVQVHLFFEFFVVVVCGHGRIIAYRPGQTGEKLSKYVTYSLYARHDKWRQ